MINVLLKIDKKKPTFAVNVRNFFKYLKEL